MLSVESVVVFHLSRCEVIVVRFDAVVKHGLEWWR
jgi:hypothetical protein